MNFCWVGPLAGFHKDKALQVVQARLKDLGVEVSINARHDLVVPQSDGSTRKVSGSAYKQTKDRALHHGTLLINGDLTKLNRALASPHKLTETRSIASVRSVVMNLDTLTPQSWLDSWGSAQVLRPEARFKTAPWSDWQWVMGETPLFKWSFTIEGETIHLSAHKGLILELDWPSRGLKFERLEKRLESTTFFELSGGTINQQIWQNALGV